MRHEILFRMSLLSKAAEARITDYEFASPTPAASISNAEAKKWRADSPRRREGRRR